MERARIMKITQKQTGYLVVVVLWLLFFFDNYNDVWTLALTATIRVCCLVAGFQTYKYFYPKLKDSRAARLQLVFWFVIISLSVSVADFMLVEELTVEEIQMMEILEREGYPMDDFSPYGESMAIEVFFSFFFSFIFIAMSMTLSWAFLIYNKNKENQLSIARLEALNKESELNELKNQLNPHFLFNALSNIYSIAYLGDKETPNKIMELSKMLRYVIYDTDVDYISLSKEIEYLNYYIEFQKFKIKKEQQIEFNYEECDQSIKIAPLLLLPFVENAFKHSQLATEKDAWVKIKIRSNEKEIIFVVENSLSDGVPLEILDNEGIGTENLTKRLDIIYNGMYQLYTNAESSYQIYLKIQLR